MSASRKRANARGFTLLELMIAIALLATALLWIIDATSNAIAAENHAKLMTTATFLARRELVELEDVLAEKGLTASEFDGEHSGDFDEDGFKRYKWTRIVDKVTMPGQDAIQTALGAFTGGGAGSKSGSGSSGGMGGMGGGMGGGQAGQSQNFAASQFGIIKEVLEQGIRKVMVRVSWKEGTAEHFVEVAEFLTDPRRVDQAIQIPTMPTIPPVPVK